MSQSILREGTPYAWTETNGAHRIAYPVYVLGAPVIHAKAYWLLQCDKTRVFYWRTADSVTRYPSQPIPEPSSEVVCKQAILKEPAQ